MIKEHLELLSKNTNFDNKNINEYAKLIRINPLDNDVPEGHIGIKLTGLKALKMLFKN
jgi:hypothetical protein